MNCYFAQVSFRALVLPYREKLLLFMPAYSILTCCNFTTFLCDLFFLHVGGKLGFYYKDHEILPPLPGIDILPLQCFPVFYSKKNSETIIIAAFPLLYSNSKTQKLTVFFSCSGFPSVHCRKPQRRLIRRSVGAWSGRIWPTVRGLRRGMLYQFIWYLVKQIAMLMPNIACL